MKFFTLLNTKSILVSILLIISINCLSVAQTVIWTTGFESGNSACTGSAGASTTITQPIASNPNAGTNSGKMVATANNTSFTGSIITGSTVSFVSGRYYTITVYAKVSGATSTMKIGKTATATNAAMIALTGGDQLLWPGSANVTSTAYNQFTASFQASVTESKYVGFQVVSGAAGGALSTLYMDDIVITEYVDAPCGYYCAAGGSSSAAGYLSNVTFNTINNSSSAFGSYVCTGISTTVLRNSTYTLSASRYSIGVIHYINAWIDYNKDGDFADAGEQVLTSGAMATTVGNLATSTSVTIPAGATLGNTKMRVIQKYNGVPTACDVTTYADVQDYDITICQAQTVLSAASSSLCSGGSTTLSATAGYTTIQWQSSTDGITFTNIAGATGATYTTPALTATTYYTATVTPSCASYPPNTLTITVSSTPVITTQPVATSECRGSSATLSVVASPAAATYQWQYYNGASWANVANGTPANFTYTNATTSALTVATTTSATPGAYQYRCNVTACSSTLASNAATLTVNSAPAAGTLTPTSTSGACGTAVSFSVAVSGYTGTIQWQSSPDNVTWTDVYGETAATYASSVNSTTYFRTLQTLNSCTSSQSTVATVTVTGTTTATWKTTGTTAWSTASNWSTGVVPNSCTDVIIPSGGTQPTLVASATLNSSTLVCHNLTINSGATLTLTTAANKYAQVGGNLIINGTLAQSSATNTSGISMTGYGVSFGGTGTTSNLTFKVADGSNIFLIDDKEVAVFDATKSATVGTINLTSKTLKITSEFTNSGSQVHVNTGMLWLAITSSMLIDQVTLFPDYGTCFWDLTGGWTVSGNWSTIGGTGFYNFWQRSNGGTTTNNCTHLCRGNFRVLSGAGTVAFGASGNYVMTVMGDFINEGTFNHAATNEIIMNGPGLVYDALTNTFINSTVAQNITGPSVTTFTELTINNSTTGVQLNAVDANVSSALTLTAGPLYLNSQLLTVTNAATTAVTRTSGYLVSETNMAVNPSVFQWNMGATNGTYVVPFGVSGTYIPFTFAKTAGSSNMQFSTRATSSTSNTPWAGASNVSAVSNMYDFTLLADGSIPAVVDRWWDITALSGSTSVTANLTFTYRGSENTITSPTSGLSAQHWNGTFWDPPVGSGTGVTSGTGTVTVTGANTFSPWVLSKTAAPLPVELAKFEGDCSDNNIILKWATSSERNSKEFLIEKSLDKESYTVIGSIKGSGNSSQTINYSYTDNSSSKGDVFYYRLRQIDFDGKSKNSEVISVKSCKGSKVAMILAPNPTNSTLTLTIQSAVKQNGSYEVYDAVGKLVYTQKVELENGINKLQLDASILNDGIYFLNLNLETESINAKFIKQGF